MRNSPFFCKIVSMISIAFVGVAPFFAAQAGEVNNGGGWPELILAMAYEDLPYLLSNCVASAHCVDRAEERVLLEKVRDSLPEEGARTPAQVQFRKSSEMDFVIDGVPRLAITGDSVGDPIYFNLDILYPVGGSPSEFHYADAVASLVHELGHHQGWRDHQTLDRIGAHVALGAERDVGLQSTDLFDGFVTVVSRNRYRKCETAQGGLFCWPGLSSLIVQGNSARSSWSVDLSSDLHRELLAQAGPSSVLDGFGVYDVRWKRGAREGNVFPILGRACMMMSWRSGGQGWPSSQTYEIRLDLVPSDRGVFKPVDNSLKISPVTDDWLRCPNT